MGTSWTQPSPWSTTRAPVAPTTAVVELPSSSAQGSSTGALLPLLYMHTHRRFAPLMQYTLQTGLLPTLRQAGIECVEVNSVISAAANPFPCNYHKSEENQRAWASA